MRFDRLDKLPVVSWAGMLSPLFLALLAAQLYVGLFLSEESAASPSAQAFVQHVRSVLLAVFSPADIANQARNTRFPSVALLSSALLWTSCAVLLVYNTIASAWAWPLYRDWYENWRPMRDTRPLKAGPYFAAFLAWVFGLVGLTMVPGGIPMLGAADLSVRAVFTLLQCTLLSMSVLFTSWLPVTLFVLLRSRRRKDAR